MSGAKHTPGPWAVCGRYIEAPRPLGSPVITGVVTVADVRSGHCADLAEADANCCLIAAAPKMLEALDALQHALRMGYPAADILAPESPIRQGIAAAVLAARGGES